MILSILSFNYPRHITKDNLYLPRKQIDIYRTSYTNKLLKHLCYMYKVVEKMYTFINLDVIIHALRIKAIISVYIPGHIYLKFLPLQLKI